MIQDFYSQLKTNWITSANLILLLTLFANQIKWQTITEQRQTAVEELASKAVLEERIKVFVPRVEAERRWEYIEKSLDRIESKLDKE